MASDPPAVAVPLADGLDHGAQEWEAATAAVLRKSGRLTEDAPDSEVWTALATTTLDGICLPPLGTPELSADLPDAGLPGHMPFTRGAGTHRESDGWDVRAWFTDPDADRTSADVVTDLENGVNSVWLAVGEGAVAMTDLARILEPVLLDLAPVVLDAPDDPLGAARALDAVIEQKATQAHGATNYGADPIGAAVRARTEADLVVAIEVARLASARGVRGIVVDASAVHDQGASDAQELAYSLLAGVGYLRALVEAGFDVEVAAAQIDVRYAVTDEQFPTIAKLRAARRLWARLLDLSGVPEQARGQRQHAVTSRPMMSTLDPYVNMLRTTIAGFAAGVGGADAVTVLPFDEPLGLPEAFSRRIARNQSSLLIHEAHLGKVVDPAGGSHAVEKLTDELARTAWTLFGELDGQGGLDAALAVLRSGVEETVARREQQIATRERPLTGVSEFPHLHETRPERRSYGREPVVRRHGAAFEAMRSEPVASKAFLATMGPLARHTARATFMTNLLASGGIDVVVAGATDGIDDVLEAYRASGSPAVACLAGAEPVYAEWGADLVTALRGAGARYVVVAGRADLGADDRAVVGGDALAFLRRTREELAS